MVFSVEQTWTGGDAAGIAGGASLFAAGSVHAAEKRRCGCPGVRRPTAHCT